MKIISMFTPGFYAVEVERLTKSIDKVGMADDFWSEQVMDHGNWHLNVRQKADVILKAHHTFPGEKLLWVDADAFMHEDVRPFMEALECDFAAFWLADRLQSGTMFFMGSPLSQELAYRWVAFNAVCASQNGQGICPGGGQANLEHLILHNPPPGLKRLELPVGYCYIFDLFKKRFPDAVAKIEHLQASREAIWCKGIDDSSKTRRLQRVAELGT